METPEFFQILGDFGALAIGLVLGLLGSGGSLMAIPIFTYLFHINPITTTAYSLFVVGTSASVGAVRNFKRGFVDLRIVIIFAVPCFVSVYLVRKFFMKLIPVELIEIGSYIVTKDMAIMVLLAFLMSLAALSMLGKNQVQHKNQKSKYSTNVILVLAGAVIGVLTGVVGIGGGFLIIPALVIYVGLPIKKAVTTSLLIIAFKSLVGFLGDMDNIEINWSFLLGFTMIAVFGIVLGSYLSYFIKGERLKKCFALFLLVMALGIFLKELFVSE